MTAGPNQKSRVKFMPAVHIEREAKLLLDEWAEKGHEISVPIPPDELVEKATGKRPPASSATLPVRAKMPAPI